MNDDYGRFSLVSDGTTPFLTREGTESFLERNAEDAAMHGLHSVRFAWEDSGAEVTQKTIAYSGCGRSGYE